MELQSEPHIADRANTFPWAPVLFAIAIIAGFAGSALIPLPWPGLDDGPAHVIGFGFGLIAIVLIATALLSLKQGGTTVMPNGISTTLMTTGPYKWLRNPIYLGEVFILLFFAEVSKNVWFVPVALLFAVIITRLQIVPEERHLEHRFGYTYRAYKDRTRRWI